MNIKQITSHVFYAGVNDRTTPLFESLWQLPLGVSYNSYIVKGNEKTALIDGTHLGFTDTLISNVLELTGGKAPDYLVINHMEPDHSGAVGLLKLAFPEIIIVGNAKTADMVKGYHHVTEGVMTIKDGDTIDLGGLHLSFHLTPMVHWPETMMTFCIEDKVLFTGDAFGCFGALNGAVIDNEMDTAAYFPEMMRYYSNIVAKYGTFVQKAFTKVGGLEFEYVCSTHGPVWHDEKDKVLNLYSAMSRWEAEEGVVIVYGSMYGNTQALAEEMAVALAERGIKSIKIHNAGNSPLSFILADIMRYKGVLLASPTYNGEIFPPMETVVKALTTRGMANRTVATIGSFTWGPQAVKKMRTMLSDAKIDVIDPIVEMRQSPDSTLPQQCAVLADAMVEAIRKA